MTKTSQYGWINDKGQLVLPERTKERLKEDLKSFPACDVELIIKKRGKRSSQQNRYYWSVIVAEIRIEFRRRGITMDSEQVHEFLKLHFNKQYVYGEGGEVIAEYGGSTTEMNKEQFCEYLDSIIQWCAEKLGIVIPAPNEQAKMFEA